MIKANDITRKSWIKYDKNSDFPIQNIPFGVFKAKDSVIHIGSIIGETVISLSQLEKLGYFKNTLLQPNSFQSKTLNIFLNKKKKYGEKLEMK